MTKLFSSALLTAALFCSASASAYMIQGSTFAGTNVGGLDTLVGQTTGLANSSTATETKWVNTLLTTDTTFTDKTESVDYFATESSNVFAFQLRSEPGYFLIKNARWWALFENNASASWGVVDFSLLDKGFKLPDLKEMEMSHVTEFGKYPKAYAKVPEPSSLLIFGLGLLGLSAARRRSQKS